jgi:CRP-like cAMP-binding protein
VLLTLERVLFLKKVDIFAQVDDDALVDLATATEEREFPAGERIIQEGDTGREMFIVVDGCVRIYRGEQTLAMLGKQGVFGELAALDPEPRNASVAAVVDTRTLILRHNVLIDHLVASRELAMGVIRFLIRRMRAIDRGGVTTPERRILLLSD